MAWVRGVESGLDCSAPMLSGSARAACTAEDVEFTLFKDMVVSPWLVPSVDCNPQDTGCIGFCAEEDARGATCVACFMLARPEGCLHTYRNIHEMT